MRSMLLTILVAACAPNSSTEPDAAVTIADARPGVTVGNVACNLKHTTVQGAVTTVKHFGFVDGIAPGDLYELEYCGLVTPPSPCSGCVESGDAYPALANGGICQRDRGGTFVGGQLRVDCGSDVTTSAAMTSTYWTSIKIYR